MKCIACDNELTTAQIKRGNKFCSKPCARKGDWQKRNETQGHCPGCRCFMTEPESRRTAAFPEPKAINRALRRRRF